MPNLKAAWTTQRTFWMLDNDVSIKPWSLNPSSVDGDVRAVLRDEAWACHLADGDLGKPGYGSSYWGTFKIQRIANQSWSFHFAHVRPILPIHSWFTNITNQNGIITDIPRPSIRVQHRTSVTRHVEKIKMLAMFIVFMRWCPFQTLMNMVDGPWMSRFIILIQKGKPSWPKKGCAFVLNWRAHPLVSGWNRGVIPCGGHFKNSPQVLE